MIARLLFVAGALLVAPAVWAQTEPIKFGKVDPQDLTAAPFRADSAAAAVVLCDYGVTRFVFRDGGFQLETDRITRLKILKKAGYDAATVQVPLYHRGTREEKINGLRGFTYNLVNGQPVKTKLVAANTFGEDLTPNVRVRKFTLPDVHEGAVIEYAYTVTSDFLFNFQDWTFQRDIPVRWSEYRAAIPEYFDYHMVMQGYYTPAIQTQEDGQVQFTENVSGGYVGGGLSTQRVAATTETVSARVTNHRWVMKDLPALREEPFMTTSDDYVAKIDFEMAGYRLPNSGYQAVAGTWSKINSDLLADDNFGAQLDRGNFLKAQMQALATKYPDPAERAAAVRQVVMQSVRYDGHNRLYTEGSLKRAYDAHRGTSADVNLLLLAALRDAGLAAQPVLLSTRDHGRVSQQFPLLEKFNYVIALVPLADGKELLVDATEPMLPCGVLPERCLSQIGRLITPKEADARWIDLTPAQRHVHFQLVQLTLGTDGHLSGQVHEEHAGYAGADERTQLASLGEKKYLAEHHRHHEGWTVPTNKILGQEAVQKPLGLDYTFSQPAEEATPTADLLYLSPLSSFVSEQNPFRHDDRIFPVDFGAPQEETTMITLTLPAGYELAEQPKPTTIELPDGGGRYLYSVTSTSPGTVQLTSRLNLRKSLYAATDYQNLREFYRLMLAKQAEKLVIKKKA